MINSTASLGIQSRTTHNMKLIIILLTLFLSACSTTSNNFTSKNSNELMKVIQLSEAAAPNGVNGTFEMYIKATGAERSVVFLNTELDYRDRRNVSVALHPKLSKKLTELYGVAPEIYFVNKTIKATGTAKRVKILFISNGKPTKKYYYQTHIRVSSLKQIKVLS